MSDRSTLTFKEWVVANPSVPFNKRVEKYNQYLQTVLVDGVLVEDVRKSNAQKELYKNFLQRLRLLYKSDPDILDLGEVDFDDEEQLRATVSVFSQKLQDIAKYYLQKRRNLKTKSTEYSSKGSVEGLKRAVEDVFFGKYSRSEGYVDPRFEEASVLNELEERETLARRIRVEVEELYDTSSQDQK